MLPRRVPMASKNPVREAAAAFVRGTAFGWGKRDLATWLVCQYSPCLASDAAVHPDLRLSARVGEAFGSVPPPPPRDFAIDEECVERLVLETRSIVLKLLGDLAWPSHRATIADRAIRNGAVIHVGAPGSRGTWAPVGRRSMRLAQRVASLFIADALNHSADYRDLALCRDCGALGFSGPIPHDTLCDRALRVA
jgi:hypothetical protein